MVQSESSKKTICPDSSPSLGFRVWGVWAGLGFKGQGSNARDEGLGFRDLWDVVRVRFLLLTLFFA